MKKVIVKINIRGGILSPGDLNNILETADNLKCETIHLGERQNLYLEIEEDQTEAVKKKFEEWHYDFEIDSNIYPNIISSYGAENLYTTFNNWLSEGIYRDVLDSFDFKPSIKINIVDNTQGLIPLFTGNLNFISSASPNFWYLYVRKPSSQQSNCWPELIYGTDISAISKVLEDLMNREANLNFIQLYSQVQEKHKFITIEKELDLVLPRVRFPYYEGMNKLGDGYWLGIYRRNNDFTRQFLKSLCALCFQTKIGLLNLTSWKSLLIKGIKEEDRIKWEMLLGKYGINIRHSSIELNWQIKDGDKFGLKLKKYLIKKFDNRDIRTYGLSFAIRNGHMNIHSSIILDRKPVINILGVKVFDLYDISYAEGFNPNNQNYSLFAQKISKKHLTDYIVELCRIYYAQLNLDTVSTPQQFGEDQNSSTSLLLPQCIHCFTVYNENIGDPFAGILAGTSFESLPETYNCPLCDNPKKDFVKNHIHVVIK